MRFSPFRCLLTLLLSSALAGCAAAPRQAALPVGAKYVAMGSSFAAGPGLPPYVPDAPARCGRSAGNYAQQLAAKRGLALTDVTCSGATTGAVLEGWAELPAQVTAIDADTRLVTVTIGGNDVGYIGNMISASCLTLARNTGSGTEKCRTPSWAEEEKFQQLAAALIRIGTAVRERAPNALLIFVEYPAILPPTGTCAATPLDPADADRLREVERRLRDLTGLAAKQSGALLLPAAKLSLDHGVCDAEPWMEGFPVSAGKAPYHPNMAGMSAVAVALDGMLPR